MGIGLNLPVSIGNSSLNLQLEERTANTLKLTPEGGTGVTLNPATSIFAGIMTNKQALLLNAIANFYRFNILNEVPNDFTGLSALMNTSFALVTTEEGNRYFAVKSSKYAFGSENVLIIALEGVQYSFVTSELAQSLPNGISLYQVPSAPTGIIPGDANGNIPFIWYRLNPTTNNGSPLDWFPITESRDLGLFDANKLFRNEGFNDIVLRIPRQSELAWPVDLAFGAVARSTGTIAFEYWNGTEWVGARSIAQNQIFNILRNGPDTWEPYNPGNFEAYVVNAVQGIQLHTQANAVSIANEADSTAGWTGSSSSISSVTGDVNNGTYAIECVAPGNGPSERMNYSFLIVNGKSYEIKIVAKLFSGAIPSFAIWQGFSGFSSRAITTEWQEYTFNVIANVTGTGIIRLGYAGGASTFRIDKVSIIELD